MAIMAFVSQNEKEFHACPSMPHAVAADGTHAVAGDGTHAVAGDGSHAVAAARALRLPPVELGAEGQALSERLGAFRTQAVRKTTKFPRLSRSPLEYENVFFSSGSQRTTHLVRRPCETFQ